MFGCGGKDRNGVGSGVFGALIAFHVRRKHRIADARRFADPRKHVAGVGELRYRFRAHERRRFDPSQPGRRQQIDVADFVVGGNDFRFVLEPVASAHFEQRDAFGKAH